MYCFYFISYFSRSGLELSGLKCMLPLVHLFVGGCWDE